MKNILVASNNKHKIDEIRTILKELNIEVFSLKDLGIDINVEENGDTFIENAYIKAKAIYDFLEKKDYFVLSDDSGLSVDALDGAPGIYSARFAGEHGNDNKNNIKLLEMLEGIEGENRRARFICAMVLITGEDSSIEVEGEVEGFITNEFNGNCGFGYDPLFYTKVFNKTFGELREEEKNSISHRGNALKKLKEEILKEGV